MSIGDRLREARESRNVTLHQIAERTNISVRFLEALEKGQIDKLPGGIFTRGFVRSYASQVGLDPDETVKAFVAVHPQVRTDDDGDESQERSVVPTLLLALGVLVVLVAIGAGVYWWMTRPASAASVAGAPSAPSPPSPALVNADLSTDAPTSAPPPQPLPPPVPGPSPAAAEAAPAAPVEQAAASTMPLRLTVAPSGRCWVQVRADGRVLLAREVLVGERVDIEAAERLEIVAGDAGTFAYQLNGQTGRELGAAGRVGRAEITTANLTSFQVGR